MQDTNGTYLDGIHASDSSERSNGTQGDMTVREAGRKGGEMVKRKHGPNFYEEIGRKGGEARKNQMEPGGYEALGHKGGQRVKQLIEEGKRAEHESQNQSSGQDE